MEYEVIDNFLKKDQFKIIERSIISCNFPLYYQENIAYAEDIDPNNNSIFCHQIYSNGMPISEWYKLLYDNFFVNLEFKALLRSKINCYPSREELITHKYHVDYPYSHKGAILYLNTCDGFTILEDGTKIESIKNRVLLFDPGKKHASTNCTNQRCRWNIILNYL